MGEQRWHGGSRRYAPDQEEQSTISPDERAAKREQHEAKRHKRFQHERRDAQPCQHRTQGHTHEQIDAAKSCYLLPDLALPVIPCFLLMSLRLPPLVGKLRCQGPQCIGLLLSPNRSLRLKRIVQCL